MRTLAQSAAPCQTGYPIAARRRVATPRTMFVTRRYLKIQTARPSRLGRTEPQGPDPDTIRRPLGTVASRRPFEGVSYRTYIAAAPVAGGTIHDLGRFGPGRRVRSSKISAFGPRHRHRHRHAER